MLKHSVLRNLSRRVSAVTRGPLKNGSLISAASARACSSATVDFPAAYDSVFGKTAPEVAFLGTGPMALSMAANMLKTAADNGVQTPKVNDIIIFSCRSLDLHTNHRHYEKMYLSLTSPHMY